LTAQIQTALDKLDQPLPEGTAEKLGVLIDELLRWNRKINLTAIRDRNEMITTHLLDSLVAAPLLHSRLSSPNGNSRCSTAIIKKSCSRSMQRECLIWAMLLR
jgi:16S rRNA G527 N7-methylase RsmG